MERKVTKDQLDNIRFCEFMLHIKFTGSLDDVQKVERFLSRHLYDAEMIYRRELEE